MKFLVVLILAIIIGSEGSYDPTLNRPFQPCFDGQNCLYPNPTGLGLIGLPEVIVNGVVELLFGPCGNSQPNVLYSQDPISTDPNVGFSFTCRDENGKYICPLPNSSVGCDPSCNEVNSMLHAFPTTDGWYTVTNNDNKRWKWGDDGSVNWEYCSSLLTDHHKFKIPQGSFNGIMLQVIDNGQNKRLSSWAGKLVLGG